MLGLYLQDHGYISFSAADGVEGLDLVEKEHPDLVLLDICMPGKDGIQVAREIHKKHPEIPVIMVTAFSDQTTRMQASRLQTSGFVTKPFSVEELVRDYIQPALN